PANGGEAIQVTRDGGAGPLETTDGKFLLYTKALLNSNLWRLPLSAVTVIRVLGIVVLFNNLVFLRNTIYFHPLQGDTSSIRFLSLDTNTTSTIATFQKPLGEGLAASPDGKWLLYTQIDQSGSELMLVENFR